MWLFMGVALAQQPLEVEAAVGLESSAADLLMVRRGARAQVAVRSALPLGVTGAVSWYPNLGELDWTRETHVLVDDNEIVPRLTRDRAQGLLGVELTPVQVHGPELSSALRLQLSGGAVWTEDDLRLAQLEDRQSAVDWQHQVHPTWAWGASTEVMGPRVGLRGRYAQTRYLERIAGHTNRVRRVWLGAEVVFLAVRRDTD